MSPDPAFAAHRIDLETYPGPAALLDPEGRITAVNAEWRAAGAGDPDAIEAAGRGDSYLDVASRSAGVSIARFGTDLAEVLAGRRGEASSTCRAGSGRWYRAVARPIVHDGTTRGAIVTHVDMPTLGFLADNTHEGVVITDAEYRVEWINRAMRRMCGYTLAEMIGRRPGEILHGPATEPDMVAAIKSAIDRGEPCEAEFINYHKSGRPYRAHLAIAPIYKAGETRPARYIATQRDVTREHREGAFQAVYKTVLAKLAADTSVPEILQGLVESLEMGTMEMRLSVMTLERTTNRLCLVAAPSLPAAYTDSINGLAIGPAVGSCGAAAWHGQRVIASDITDHPNWRDYQDLAALSGMRACWSQPVVDEEGEVLAVFAMYTPTPREPSQEEMSFIERAGEITGIVLSNLQLQAKLKERERETREVFSNVPIGLTRTTKDDRFLAANPAFVEIVGYTSEEELINNARPTDFYPDRETRGQILRQADAAGSVSDQLVRFLRRDNQVFWAMLSFTRVIQASGSQSSTIYESVVRDVTAWVEAEAAVARSEGKFRSVFAEAGVGIALVDLDGRLMEVNPAFGEILGWSPDDMVGVHFAALTDPRDVDAGLEYFAELNRGARHVYRMDKRYIAADGTIIWARLTVSQVRATEGTQPFVVAMVEDITDRRHLEEELRAARDAAEDANRAKTAFLANISHELRTPLNAVIGMSEIIRDRIFGEDVTRYADYARDICESGRHLRDLLDQLLELTKLESGGYTLEATRIDPDEVMRSATRMLSQQAEASDIALSVTKRSPVSLHADERALRQVLVNLISNAVKYAGAGSRVDVAAEQKHDGELVFTVADNGVGMDPDDLQRLCEPFERGGDHFTRANQRGSGLGLAISRQLMRQHGGELYLDSSPGAGTTGTAVLPPARCLG